MSPSKMTSEVRLHHFTFILAAPAGISPELEDAMFQAGCDDALLFQQNGILHLEFEREAPSLKDAVSSAMAAITSARVPVDIAGVEPGDIVTAAEIGRRLGLSREYVRLLVNGERGEGQFPMPIARPTSKMYLWSWREVAHFAQKNLPGKHKYQRLYEQAEYMHHVNRQLREPKG